LKGDFKEDKNEVKKFTAIIVPNKVINVTSHEIYLLSFLSLSEYPKLCQFKFIGLSHSSGNGHFPPI